MKFMALCVEVSGSVFVKDRDFFVSQGGDKQEWCRRWVEIEADSIEHARRIGCDVLKGARPYNKQAKP